MKTSYTVPQVPGSTRTSERPYTHAVVGARNLVLARAQVPEYAEYMAGDTFDTRTRQVQTGAGNSYLYKSQAGSGRPFMVKVSQEDFDKAVAFLAEHPDRAAYLAQDIAKRLALIGTADEGPLMVLQWSMSHKNALAKVGEHSKYHSSVRVVECVPIEKKAKASKVTA